MKILYNHGAEIYHLKLNQYLGLKSLRCPGILTCFSDTCSSVRKNVCDTERMFATSCMKTFQIRVYSYREEPAPRRANSFPIQTPA